MKLYICDNNNKAILAVHDYMTYFFIEYREKTNFSVITTRNEGFHSRIQYYNNYIEYHAGSMVEITIDEYYELFENMYKFYIDDLKYDFVKIKGTYYRNGNDLAYIKDQYYNSRLKQYVTTSDIVYSDENLLCMKINDGKKWVKNFTDIKIDFEEYLGVANNLANVYCTNFIKKYNKKKKELEKNDNKS